MTRRYGRSGKGYNRASRSVSGGGASAAACGTGEVACATAGGHVCCSESSGGCDDPLCGLNIANAPGGGSPASSAGRSAMHPAAYGRGRARRRRAKHMAMAGRG